MRRSVRSQHHVLRERSAVDAAVTRVTKRCRLNAEISELPVSRLRGASRPSCRRGGNGRAAASCSAASIPARCAGGARRTASFRCLRGSPESLEATGARRRRATAAAGTAGLRPASCSAASILARSAGGAPNYGVLAADAVGRGGRQQDSERAAGDGGAAGQPRALWRRSRRGPSAERAELPRLRRGRGLDGITRASANSAVGLVAGTAVCSPRRAPRGRSRVRSGLGARRNDASLSPRMSFASGSRNRTADGAGRLRHAGWSRGAAPPSRRRRGCRPRRAPRRRFRPVLASERES